MTDLKADAPPSPLSFPVFRAIWLASVASNFGAVIQLVGASWMMTSLTASPQFVALVQASTALPIMFLALLGGAAADNLDRRAIMLWAQLFMLTVSVALTVCAWSGVLTPWLLLCFTFLIGCGTALNGPAWHASVGDMVPRVALPAAIAFNSMGFNIARSLGPALGGVIVAAAGASGAFLANVVSYLGLIVVLKRWRPARIPQSLPREGLAVAMAAGLRYAFMSPHVRAVLFRAAAFGTAASAVPALMPLVARDLMDGGAIVYGFLLGAFGVGAVTGALASGRLRRRFTNERIVQLASLALALGAAVTSFSTYMAATTAALAVAGASWVLALSTFNFTVQMASPRWVVGRGVALFQTTLFAGMAAGSWCFGVVAENYGITIALMAAGLTQIAGLLAGLSLPLPVVEDLNLDPLAQWVAPETDVSLEPSSGPVIITVQYCIDEADVGAFLRAMNERRRVRRRDGAQRWTLLRDLADSRIWVERYGFPTWVEYVRHNHRRTHSDAPNDELIRSLHIGPGVPLVRRMIERQTGPSDVSQPPPFVELAEAASNPTRST